MKKIAIILLLICTVVVAQEPYRILNSFNAGQLSPLLTAREDLAKYQSGCSVMINVFPLPQGGAQKRPGTKYVAGSKEDTKIRLLPFQFSTSQSYIIELGNQYMRFFTDKAAVTTGVGTENATTIAAAGTIVGNWLLNDNVGTKAVLDDDGNTYDGSTVTNNTSTLHATGKVGTGSIDFAGKDAVEIADAAGLSFAGDVDMGITAWAYITDAGVPQVVMSKWESGVAKEYRFDVDEDMKLRFSVFDDSTSLSNDLIAHWKLNENAANTTVDNAEGDVNHDGVSSTNTSTLHASGKVGTGSFDMDGQYIVTVTHNAEQHFDDTADEPISITAWVYVTNTGTDQIILSKWNTGAGAAREWKLQLTTETKLQFTTADQSAGKNAARISDSALSTGWHFVGVVYDNADVSWSAATAANFMTLYVDGEVEASTAATDTGYLGMEDLSADVLIGALASAGTAEQFFGDKLDNIALLNVALTADDMTSLYRSGSGTEDFDGQFPFRLSDSALSLGWNFVGITYDGDHASWTAATAMNYVTLYVNGAAVDSTASNLASGYTAMEDTAAVLRIGAQDDSSGTIKNVWQDKIDAVTLFSTLLSAANITSLYTSASYEIETPYLTADLFELKFEQSADVLYLTHPDYETRELSRLANDSWLLDNFNSTEGPFISQNTTITSKIAASALTGSVTLTATGDGNTPFVSGTIAGHIPSGSAVTDKSNTGALFKLVHPIDTLSFSGNLTDDYPDSNVEGTSWIDCGTIFKGGGWTFETGGTWLGTIEVQRNYTIGAGVAADGWETVYQFISDVEERNTKTTTRTENDADADYRMICTNYTSTPSVYFSTDQTEVVGIVEITSVASSTSATGTVIKTLGSTDATHKWSEGSWSNYRGWPQTIAFFEDRLIFGGNASQPDTIWGSQPGDYSNMLAGADDDEALLFTLTSRQVNAIEWIVGKDKILIGTSGAEWTMRGSSDEPLTPSNVKAEQQSTYGSANLQATLANESVLFFQRGAQRMRELAYNWDIDSYVSPDMTILAKEITGDGITDTAFQQIPDGILWCIREDGDIATFSYERKENITSWSKQITEGDFESVAIISGSVEDEVWVSVEREIDGSTVRYIEYFPVRDFGTDLDDAYYVDCGITYDSTATTTVTGLSHLEGETVSVFADSIIQTSQAVSGGEITITSASTVQTGLPFVVLIKTMPLSWVGQGMTIHGKIKRISEVIASWHNSGDFSIGRDAGTLQSFSIAGMTTAEERKTFPPGHDRYGYAYIAQSSPEPLTLLALMLEFTLD